MPKHAKKNRFRGLGLLTVASLLATGLLIAPIESEPAVAAPTTVDLLCRSTDGTGAALETNKDQNGYFVSNSDNDSDSITGIQIDPLFAKRMYVDPGRNFDATYIAYRITNNSGAAQEDLTLTLDFIGTAVSPVSSDDSKRYIGDLANNAAKTVYFMVKANNTTDAKQRHDLRVMQGGAAGTQLAGCYNEIDGVQRSLSASANKVTGITVNTPNGYKLGSTFDIVVDGTPGKVGQGNGIDGSVMAISPATQSSWPTKAIRLESVSVLVKGISNNSAVGTCVGLAEPGLATNLTSGNDRKVRFDHSLIIRNFGSCATNTKQSYTATYTYRIVGFTATDPVIQPYASIGSGTQVKYTGTLPSTIPSVSLTSTTTDLSVDKSYVSSTVVGSDVDITYRITTSSTSAATFTEIIDRPDTAATLITATFTDAVNTTAIDITALKQDLSDANGPYWSFQRDFSVTSTVSAVLEYTVRIPIPSVDTTFSNQGYIRFGDLIIGSGPNITGIDALVTTTGTVSPTATTTAVPKTPQTISLNNPGTQGAGNEIILNPTSDSGLSVTLTTSDPNICTVELFDGVWTLTTVAEGTCVVTASQTGNDDFDAAADKVISFTVLKGQVITDTTSAFSGTSSGSTATVTVVADSKLEVSLVSIDTEVCTAAISAAYNSTSGETTYTITQGSTTGTCILQASQGGGTDGDGITWGPAPTRDITIGVGNPQAIDFTGPTTTSYSVPNDTTFNLVATAKAPTTTGSVINHPVSFTSSTPSVCSVRSLSDSDGPISGMGTNGVTTVPVDILGPGTCTITATQDGYNDSGVSEGYAAAQPVTRSFTVSGNGNTAQVLVFDAIAPKTYGDSSFTASVTSKTPDTSGTNTGLKADLVSTTPAICRVSSVTLAGGVSSVSVVTESAGDCILSASQLGDATYAPVTNQTLTITIAPKQLTVAGLTATKVYDGTDTVVFSGNATLSGVVSGDGSGVSVSGTPTASYTTADVITESVAVSGLSLSGSKAANYTLASATVSASITPMPITVTFQSTTVSPTADVVCLDEITVSPTLPRSGSVTAVSCTGIPAKDQNSNTEMATGPFTVTPSSVSITEDISGTPTDKTSNYTITPVAGTLTVSSAEIPTIETENLTVLYGTLITELADDVDPTNANGKTKAKRGNGNQANGTLKHFKDGQEITGELAAGEHQLEIRFTPAGGSGLAQATAARTIVIQKRQLKLAGVSAQSKEYDGTTTATLTGTAELDANLTGHDVLTGDDVEIDTVSGSFVSKDVGTVSVNLNAQLKGSKKDNYELASQSLTGQITPRGLVLKAPVYTKLSGEPDPTFAHEIQSGSFAPGEDETTIGGVSVDRATGETAGAYDVNVNVPQANASQARGNYNISVNPGKLYVARPAINIQTTNGVLTDDEVVCECEGFNPGSTVTLTMYSTPTVLATDTVASDGTCPLLADAIPDGTEGSHTLEISGEFPNGEPLVYTTTFTAQSTTTTPPATTNPPAVINEPTEEKTLVLVIDEGDGEVTEIESSDDGVELPEPKTPKPGFTFDGWDIDGEIYQPGEVVVISEGITAVAVWTAESSGDETGSTIPVLADTGFDSPSLLGFGAVLVGFGAVLMRVARRRA